MSCFRRCYFIFNPTFNFEHFQIFRKVERLFKINTLHLARSLITISPHLLPFSFFLNHFKVSCRHRDTLHLNIASYVPKYDDPTQEMLIYHVIYEYLNIKIYY